MRLRPVAAMLAVLLALTALPVHGAAPVRITINGSPLAVPADQAPVTVNDRTLVPMRLIFEALGARLIWEEDLRRVTALRGEVSVVLQVGFRTARIGDQEVEVDPAPRLIGDRTYVPLRFVSEALGDTVDWDDESRTAVITTDAPLPTGGLIPATGALRRAEYGPGARITPASEGLYFMDPASGRTEGWTLAAPESGEVVFAASPDQRFAITRSLSSGFLADRQTGAVYTWTRSKNDLVTAGDGLLLMAETRLKAEPGPIFTGVDEGPSGHLEGTGRYSILDAGGESRSGFLLTDDAGTPASIRTALFAPGGQRLALSTNGAIHLIDTATGEVRRLEGAGGRVLAVPGRAGQPAFAVLSSADASATTVSLYAWDGARLSHTTVPGRAVQLSPDGRYVSWEAMLGGFTPTVYITEMSTGANLYRALGASTCSTWSLNGGNRWLADSSALVVRTAAGLALLTTLGAAAAAPGPGAARLDLPMPSATDSALLGFQDQADDGSWSVGTLDRNGNLLQRVHIAGGPGYVPVMGASLFSPGQGELRFALRRAPATGAPCGDFTIPLPVRVERPPADHSLQLVVRGTGDCLNLRAEAKLTGKVVACLPDGTRLQVGAGLQPDALPERLSWSDGMHWARVSTAAGQSGWVSLTAGYVGWASP